jgi:LuxR family transcriptional regulator, positive regulator of biofilm formation
MEVNSIMRAVQENPGAERQSVVETLIWIIGANSLQNLLLGSFIKEKTGFSCRCGFDMTMASREKRGLVLYDCFSVDYTRLWVLLGSFLNQGSSHFYLSLFNVDPDAKLERDAVSRGIRGIFYTNEAPDNLSKGIETILKGELWYSRKTTTRLLLDHNNYYSKATQMTSAGLTAREKEILLAIAAGSSNSDIVDKLHISAHTAKNHIYNIYRKINIKSRLEAILWVAKYL